MMNRTISEKIKKSSDQVPVVTVLGPRQAGKTTLCSDDPVCQEWEQLTDDFVAAIASWRLGIAEIKQLCINSILYSDVDKKQKSELIASWKKAWDQFVDSVLI